MMPLARPSTSTAFTSHGDATTWFLHTLYSQRHGFVELAWIVGDPDDRGRGQFRREWHAWPAAETTICARIASLARSVGNVYLSAQLYEQPNRASRVLPGRVVFVDDAPLDLECTFSVQTSPSSKHAYFVLEQDALAETLRDLSRRAAYSLGGDKSGWDSQQLVRVPGTFNTKAKHGGHFPIVLQQESGKRYDVEQLRTLWPIVQQLLHNLGDSLDWSAAEQWLGSLGALVGENGMPRRFTNPKGQSFKVLAGVVTGDTSLDRYIVARGLVMHGYPDDEAAALLWHFCEYDKSQAKGTAWLKSDIARILAKVRAELPNIQPNPTRYHATAPAQPLPQVEPPKRGRRITLTAEKLLAFYQAEAGAGDMVMLTVAEVAQQLGVSRPTVERCERLLKVGGMIERRLFNRRQSSCVAVLRPITNTAQPSETTRDHVPSSDPLPAQQGAENTIQAAHGETHPADESCPVALGPVVFVETVEAGPVPSAEGAALTGVCSSSPARPASLQEAITEAFDAYSGVRMTRKRIERYLLDNYPALRYHIKHFDRVLANVRKMRQLAQATEREKQQLAALTERQIKAQIASAVRHIASGIRPEPTVRPEDTAEDVAKRRRNWLRDRHQLAYWQGRHERLLERQTELRRAAIGHLDIEAIEEEREQRLLLDWLDEQRVSLRPKPIPVAVRIQTPLCNPAPGNALIARLRQRER